MLRPVAAGLGWSIVPTMALAGSRLGLQYGELPNNSERIVVGAAMREGEGDPVILSLLDNASSHLG
jgi:DNA-binding transcriptional LysR family regulator